MIMMMIVKPTKMIMNVAMKWILTDDDYNACYYVAMKIFLEVIED